MSNLESVKSGLPAMPQGGSWGTEGVDAQDIKIHKILLMQGLSELVGEERASMGDFVDSVTAEKLGDTKKPVSVIPIYMWKDFTIMEELDGKFEFRERLPFTPKNSHWRNYEEREAVENGVKIRRDFAMNFLVMLEKTATDPGSLPMVISFKRTSLKAGQAIAEWFLKAQQRNRPACSFTIDIGAKMEKGEKGSYYIPEVRKVRDTEAFDTVGGICWNWYQTFLTGAAKIDESDLAAEGAEGQSHGGEATPF